MIDNKCDFIEENLKTTLGKIEEYFNKVFVEPEEPELKM